MHMQERLFCMLDIIIPVSGTSFHPSLMLPLPTKQYRSTLNHSLLTDGPVMSHPAVAIRHKPSFRKVELHKDRTLGSGAYGIVCEAKCNTLLCAAKIMHSAFHGYRLPAERFEQEIELLSMIRHPNIIQYLGVWYDPQSSNPVLLMELMDCSLTKFLKNATSTLSYRTQFNICHSVVQALAYLHDNEIYHRDLSGNNILMKGNEAKVSDFGMARLIDPESSHCPTLSTCPGTKVYMPPEALEDKPHYTEKIDCFSFGVLIIQILTTLYPMPGEQRRKIEVCDHPDIPGGSTVEVRIKEVDRRQDHISMIDPQHRLLPIALKCLGDKPEDRPSAQELCEKLNEYDGDDRMAVQPDPSPQDDLLATYDVIQSPPQQSHREEDADERTHTPDSEKSKKSEPLPGASCSRSSTTDLCFTWKSSEINAPCELFRYSDAVLCEGTAYFLPANSRKIYAYNTCVAHSQWSFFATCPYFGSSLAVANHHLTTVGGKRACAGTGYRYSLNTIEGYESSYTDKLCSITEKQDGSKMWVEKFPAMPTKRAFTTALNTKTTLIVAGGVGGDILRTVEILNIETLQWLIARDLPQPMWAASATICGNNMYILGGRDRDGSGLSTAYVCSLKDLHLPENCKSPSLTSRFTDWIKPAAKHPPMNVWIQLSNIPVTLATCVSVHCHLVAVGGKKSDNTPTPRLHMYDDTVSKWISVGQGMPAAQYSSFVLGDTDNTMIVVGGKTGGDEIMNRVYKAVAL